MARRTGTKAELMEAHYEIQQFQQQMPTISTMLGGRIEQFYKQNEGKLQAIHEKRLAIHEKYCQRSDDGKTFKQETYMKDIPGEDGMSQVPEQRVAMIEPVIELNTADKAKYLDDQRKAFNKELSDYLSQQIDWIV